VTDLSIVSRTINTSRVLELAGELDLATVETFRDLLRGLSLEERQQLVIDLTGLHFCDSSGIAALLSARARALAVHGEIMLAGVPNHLRRVLAVVGLDQMFPMYPTTQDAIEAWTHRNDSRH
jgi:anti-sigma B factor antagonist